MIAVIGVCDHMNESQGLYWSQPVFKPVDGPAKGGARAKDHSRREAGSSKVLWTFPLMVGPSSGLKLVGSSIGGGFLSIWIVTCKHDCQQRRQDE